MQSLTNGLTYSRPFGWLHQHFVFNIQLKCMFPYLSHITILVQVSFGFTTFGSHIPSPKKTVLPGSPHHCKWLPRPWWVPGRHCELGLLDVGWLWTKAPVWLISSSFYSHSTIKIWGYNWDMYDYIYIQHPTELWKKKNVSIYRRRLSMIEKLRTFFFP